MATQATAPVAPVTKTFEPEKDQKQDRLQQANEAANLGFESGKSFLHLQRVAAMFAASDLVPDAFRGNVANCSIAVNLARRLGADELMVMQNLYIVYGRPGWSSKFKIAMFNQTGRFTPIVYEFFGEKGANSYGCRARCKNRETGDEIVGPDITIQLAKDEGWYDKVSKKTGERASKWPTMTDLMLRYRSASWMIDTTAPELTMGLHTVEELIDTGALLEQAIVNTQERMEAKCRAEDAILTAIGNAPTKLDAVVDAAEAMRPRVPMPTPGKPPAAKPEEPKGKAKAPAAKPPEPDKAKVSYSDHEPEPDLDSLFAGREPGSDDK